MSKPQPPKSANDHLTALRGLRDGLEILTDEALQARLAGTGDALGRALDLEILRTREQTLAMLAARARRD